MKNKVKLGDVCDILDSKRIPISEEKRIKGEYPYYGANGIQGYINDYIFDEELVLLAEDGGNFGSKTKPIAYKISGKTWVNNHAHVLKAKDEIVSTDFLLYSLMFYDVTKLITGTTRKKLTRAGMEKITLSIPTSFAIYFAVFSLSPVSIITFNPNLCIFSIASLLVSFTTSATAINPASSLFTDIYIGVFPSFENIS